MLFPYKLILRNSNYYLIGYFDKRKDSLSVYRIDRMRIVRNHSSSYEDIQDRFDMEKNLKIMLICMLVMNESI
ncbi:MAG: WYL domain-containing protein [Coprobacillus cateniformis]